MLESMTGYGEAVAQSQNYRVSVELKSLNSKYFELISKLPRVYQKYEHKLRQHLAKNLQRGKVSLILNIEVLSEGKRKLNINQVLAQAYMDELNALREKLYIQQEIALPFLLELPEVIPVDGEQEDPEEWELIEKATLGACDALKKSRREEGGALAQDLASRAIAIRKLLASIRELAPLRIERIRERINQSMEEIRNRVAEYDPNRLEQELIFYVEKLDINEEMVRLAQHLEYFDQLLADQKSKGKQLQFLSQEMGREINTIGSKANDAQIQRLVVQMKEELEKIKEQVLNSV